MRRHAWIAIVAVVGVLLHAAAVVRHHGVMSAQSAERALLADLAIICHGAGGSLKIAAELPSDVPAQRGGSDCPVCMGMAVGFMPPTPMTLALPFEAVARVSWSRDQTIPVRSVRLHPFARGPPAAA